MSIRFIFVVALLAAIDCSSVSAQDNSSQIVVSQFVWTTGVDRDSKLHDREIHEFDKRDPLYFWTVIEGTESDLAVMEISGQLPIYHKWQRICASVRSHKPDEYREEIAVGADNVSDIISELTQETMNRDSGRFDWRTWSVKRNLYECPYRVTVVDAQDNVLFCEQLDENCVVTIEPRSHD